MNKNDVELLFEAENGKPFWWKQCEKKGCTRQVCLSVSDKFCYPHSAWYRPIVRFINIIISKLEKEDE